MSGPSWRLRARPPGAGEESRAWPHPTPSATQASTQEREPHCLPLEAAGCALGFILTFEVGSASDRPGFKFRLCRRRAALGEILSNRIYLLGSLCRFSVRHLHVVRAQCVSTTTTTALLSWQQPWRKGEHAPQPCSRPPLPRPACLSQGPGGKGL